MSFLIIFILVLLNGYFSLAEVALISIKEEELYNEESKKNASAIKVLRLIQQPAEFLSSIQVGITLIGMLEGIYGGNVVAGQIDHLMMIMGVSKWVTHGSSLVIGISIITYLSIVFGELVPKSIALQMPLKVSLSIAPSLVIFSRLLFPFVKLLTFSTQLIVGWLGIKNKSKRITEDDIKQMLSTAFKQGILEKQQYWMQENVLTFKNLTARRMMKPSRIASCISYDWKKEEVIAFIKKTPYSNFPVYQGEKTNIVGTISTKNFFINDVDPWQQGIIHGCNVPAEMLAKDVYAVFKEKKKKFGQVINKSGAFIGVLAMQDIMEGVFGDMPEKEDYAAYFYTISPKVWIAEDFIHLQSVRNKLLLPWIRDYESKYMNLAEFMTGENNGLQTTTPLVRNEVSFEVIAKGKDEGKIRITLP